MSPTSSRTYLLIHGWTGSGPQHWQTWLSHRLQTADQHVIFPQLPSPDRPKLEEWLAALHSVLESQRGPELVVLSHSLGCILWLHYAARFPNRCVASRVMLVAPPSPSELPVEIEPFFPVPLERSAVARIARSTRIVSADDDPFCREGAQATYADPLDVPLDIIPGGAHLSTGDGYGPWPAVEAWCLTGKFTTAVRRRLP